MTLFKIFLPRLITSSDSGMRDRVASALENLAASVRQGKHDRDGTIWVTDPDRPNKANGQAAQGPQAEARNRIAFDGETLFGKFNS